MTHDSDRDPAQDAGLAALRLILDKLLTRLEGQDAEGGFTARRLDGPGASMGVSVDDEAGNVLFRLEMQGLPTARPVRLTAPTAPGDHIIPIIENADGTTAFGIDMRDGSLYPQPLDRRDGTTIDFVDPDNLGDAWNAIRSTDEFGPVIRYLSRQWRETWGFEKRGAITLAQTYDPALGVVAFGGGGAGVVRPIVEEFRYHLIDETLRSPEDGEAASALAVAFLEGEYAARRALPTVVALTRVVASTVETDALPGSAPRLALRARVVAARKALEPWGKALFVDRISLSLLEGAPQTLRATADLHYAAVANSLRQEIAEAAGQVPLPVVVVSQSAGTRSDGTSEVILAEGELDWAHWSLGLIVATPRYPFPLQPGTAATLTPEAALQVSELEALAANERLAGRDWYGPSIGVKASCAGRVVTVPFTAMSALVLRDPEQHGFCVDGVTNGAVIASVEVRGTDALLTMTADPTGTLTVRYAFGETGDRGDGFPCNRGSLTDSWSRPSLTVAGTTLYRHARAGRVSVI